MTDQTLRRRKNAVAPKEPEYASLKKGDEWTEEDENLAALNRTDTARTIKVKKSIIKNSIYAPALDNMPKFLKEGPWSPGAYVFLAALICGMIMKFDEAKSSVWIQKDIDEIYLEYHSDSNNQYNHYGYGRVLIAFYMMSITIGVAMNLGVQPLTTFTVMSWNILTLRYLLTGLLTISLQSGMIKNTSLNDHHPSYYYDLWSMISMLAESLRFPSLVCSTITVSIWWVILVPAIFIYLPSSNSRMAFLKFNFRFTLLNVHFANILFAAADHLTIYRSLTFADLYSGITVALIYVAVYLFILDPIGLVWYHIFLSPRPHWCVVCYALTLALFVGVFHLWSQV